VLLLPFLIVKFLDDQPQARITHITMKTPTITLLVQLLLMMKQPFVEAQQHVRRVTMTTIDFSSQSRRRNLSSMSGSGSTVGKERGLAMRSRSHGHEAHGASAKSHGDQMNHSSTHHQQKSQHAKHNTNSSHRPAPDSVDAAVSNKQPALHQAHGMSSIRANSNGSHHRPDAARPDPIDCGSMLLRQHEALVIYENENDDVVEKVTTSGDATHDVSCVKRSASSSPDETTPPESCWGDGGAVRVHGTCTRGVGQVHIALTAPAAQSVELLFSCEGSPEAVPGVSCTCRWSDYYPDKSCVDDLIFQPVSHFGILTLPPYAEATCTLQCRMPGTDE
jgi:hypothetical protein